MNQTDASILWLMTKKPGALGSLGTNGKGGGRSGGSTWGAGERRAMARDITGSVAQMTTGITQAILASRRRPRAAAAPAAGPATIGGEAYGVEARTPWGKIAIGGTAVVIIAGLVGYIATRPKGK